MRIRCDTSSMNIISALKRRSEPCTSSSCVLETLNARQKFQNITVEGTDLDYGKATLTFKMTIRFLSSCKLLASARALQRELLELTWPVRRIFC